MSEFKKTRDVSTSKKLQPPRSLQGEEDAESTWDLILTRYPNAAPLLCQMETVIDRAEGLLQQLRAPYTHALERSSSFQIADSEDELMGPCHIEESTEVSMASEQDSRLGSVENMTPEVESFAESSLAVGTEEDNCQDEKPSLEEVSSSIGEKPSRTLIKTDASVEEQIWSNDLGSSSTFKCNSSSQSGKDVEIEENPGQVRGPASPSFSKKETESKKLPEDIEVGRSASLEAWGKVVGENVAKNKNFKAFGSREKSPGVVNTKAEEDTVSEHAKRLSSMKNGPMQQITKLNILGKKDESMQRYAATIATASKVLDTTRNVERDVIDRTDGPNVSRGQGKPDSLNRRMNEGGEKTTTSSSGNVHEEIEELEEKSEVSSESLKKAPETPAELNDQVQGNGDEAGPRSAVEILEEYSKTCGVPVEYKIMSPNCSQNKNVIMKCCFGEFGFSSCASGKKRAKREAAGKLLRCLAGRQIDGENMSDLTPLSRKQMGEIISLGNGVERETPVRKLYQICIELDAPEPAYGVHEDSGIVGNRYTVKCEALGFTTSGEDGFCGEILLGFSTDLELENHSAKRRHIISFRPLRYGVRILTAKKLAADQLLKNYYGSVNSGD